MFVKVKLDDGTKVVAWLPQDDNLWNTLDKATRSGGIRVEIKRDGEYWRFVRIVPKK